MTALVAIEQVDWDAAANVLGWRPNPKNYLSNAAPDIRRYERFAEAFARHRLAALADTKPADARESGAGWSLIGTAPKDGTLIDLWCDGFRLADCWWQENNDHFPSRPIGWICSKHAGHPFALAEARIVPTHWLRVLAPLAAAPARPVPVEGLPL